MFYFLLTLLAISIVIFAGPVPQGLSGGADLLSVDDEEAIHDTDYAGCNFSSDFIDDAEESIIDDEKMNVFRRASGACAVKSPINSQPPTQQPKGPTQTKHEDSPCIEEETPIWLSCSGPEVMWDPLTRKVMNCDLGKFCSHV